jgi:hypothetical protein
MADSASGPPEGRNGRGMVLRKRFVVLTAFAAAW